MRYRDLILFLLVGGLLFGTGVKSVLAQGSGEGTGGAVSSGPVTCQDFIDEAKKTQTLGTGSGCVNDGNACTQLKGKAIDKTLDCVAPKVCCVVTTGPSSSEGGAGGGAPVAKGPVKLKDPLGGIGVLGIISRIISTFLGILGALALLVFIYAGVVYMTAGGAMERVKHAVDTMKYGIIGLALIVFAYAIVSTFFKTLIGG
jgi:fumarate reductase subunit D